MDHRMANLELSGAGRADLSYIMATERIAGYESLVGRWDAAQHSATLADANCKYLIARVGPDPLGFAILRGWRSAERVTQLKRIALSQPGVGYGKAVLTCLIDLVFTQTEAYRLWLGVFPHNARARRAYEQVGFQTEGIARGNAYFADAHRDELIMALLRPDWQKLTAGLK